MPLGEIHVDEPKKMHCSEVINNNARKRATAKITIIVIIMIIIIIITTTTIIIIIIIINYNHHHHHNNNTNNCNHNHSNNHKSQITLAVACSFLVASDRIIMNRSAHSYTNTYICTCTHIRNTYNKLTYA